MGGEGPKSARLSSECRVEVVRDSIPLDCSPRYGTHRRDSGLPKTSFPASGFCMYVGRLGVLGGRPGFDYAVLLAFCESLIGLKRRENERWDSHATVEASSDPPLKTEAGDM